MERVPVHSEEAEQGALGAILLEPERLIRVAVSEMGVKPEAFYVPACRLVYEAVLEMADGRARAIDVLTVSEHLGRQGRLENVGGQQFLERLVDATPTAAHGEYYLDIVRQKAILRGGIFCVAAITMAMLVEKSPWLSNLGTSTMISGIVEPDRASASTALLTARRTHS